MKISGQLEHNIISRHGDEGRMWLNNLPNNISELKERWGVSELVPLENLSYNYVLAGMKGTQPIILKISMDPEELSREMLALKAFEAYGAIKIFNSTREALLLERAQPGIPLKSYLHNRPNHALEIGCKVTRRLHSAPPISKKEFLHITSWLAYLDRDWPLPGEYLSQARMLRNKLLQKDRIEVLLHGDLHHDNILQHENEWKIIDPKGVIGDPIDEVWTLISDIECDPSAIASFFGFEMLDVVQWYFVRSILAACWNIEDNLSPGKFLNMAARCHGLFLTS